MGWRPSVATPDAKDSPNFSPTLPPAAEVVWKVVDTALDLAGGYGIFAACGIERLFRDARLSRIHPAHSALTHEIVAKLTLGIDPDAQPRWG